MGRCRLPPTHGLVHLSRAMMAGNGFAKNGCERQAHMQVQVQRFFLPLAVRDPVSRSIALETIVRTFEAWINGYGSPKLLSNIEMDPKTISPEFIEIINHHLPNILKLSINCPFPDVRDTCIKVLKNLQDHGMKIPRPLSHGPSCFIPAPEVIPPDTEDEQTQMLYREVFIHNNRLDHISQVMAYHPKYLEAFLRTQHFILRGDGPLPFSYRHYIAIMAAGRHQCAYLINLQKQEFLLNGGDHNWLKGLQHIPQKLRDLYEINKILGHRPWLINKGHIEKLTKGMDNWSLSELVHAIVILAHFHTLSSLVYGCGVQEELDHENGHTLRPPSVSSDNGASESEASSAPSPAVSSSGSDVDGGVEVLMQRMKTLSEQSAEEPSHEEKLKRFAKVESQAVALAPSGGPISKPSADISVFIEDPGYMYQDFARRGEVSDIPTFRVQDYSWDDHGYSLVNSIYNDIGNYLDEMFKITYGLTYFTMGKNKCIDTTVFRRAVWNYIQCIFGIRHDDYDYSEVNDMIERNLKAYVKTICVYPERITKKDYENVMRDFEHSEKVHVNLMVVEARMQAELLYALRAIMQYMT